ncbi:ATP-dependent helicase HrpB [Allorhodopirellula solitaria]|uniref:ATP-dependent RNA helicase HrpB n=1 Tax=Allorhodopirellula solitaria TaxID=2527987 RepID=A0A5C5X0P1_9BACT|nr:ATP-dependent helicase HrpB [Allorhodopirellula solitaria]TWT55735.1 ATP-dependent RNA helicase HrpB [Allorhodopirellula solitaria]
MNDRLTRPTLPIDEVLPELQAVVSRGCPVVLKAPPGAGKTTGVPLALLDLSALQDQQIWVVQPRRLAARSVAEFLARSLGQQVGETVGYHVRHDRKESAHTRVLLMTTGMFLRRMQSDPLLERAGCVILDEFHERSIDLDLSLALTQRLRTQLRGELRLIVMSATLDPQPIADYLGADAVSLACEGRSFPVEIVFHDRWRKGGRRRGERSVGGGDFSRRAEPSVDYGRLGQAIVGALEQTAGHVLVFLPGIADIHRARHALTSVSLAPDVSVLPLHGSLSPSQQDVAIRGGFDRGRKIILSTNIAETSVTVEGVTAVVDSGLAKIPVLDSRLGLTRLQTEPISIASADQRAGRAGRTAPGVAHRMWSAAAQRTREAYDRPEILRGDLAATVLTLASLGERADESIAWFTPPPDHSLRAAQDRLSMLGALDSQGRITTLGREMARLPLDPRVARFVLAARPHLPPAHVAIASALLSEPNPLNSDSAEYEKLSLPEKAQWIAAHPQSLRRSFRNVCRQIERAMGAAESLPVGEDSPPAQSIARALLAAYPDRVVLRRGHASDRGVMVGRRGVIGLLSLTHLDRSADCLLCYDVDGSSTQSRVRGAVAIDVSWLPPEKIEHVTEVDFDYEREAVVCRDVRRYEDLILSETPVACEQSDAAANQLLQAALQAPERVMPSAAPGDENNLETALHRIELTLDHAPDSESLGIAERKRLWEEVCRDLCHGRRSFAELRGAPWKDYLIGKVGYDFWQRVQADAPTHLVLPSGNRVKVGYAEGRPPWLEARIQECFGWQSTPRILGGRVAIQLHLLGPNRRPQQITDDLESFWANTYGEIRKELRRRYPKHHWPEDPQTAQATHNGLKPK